MLLDLTDDKSTLIQVNGLVPGFTPLPEPMVIQIYIVLWRQWATNLNIIIVLPVYQQPKYEQDK